MLKILIVEDDYNKLQSITKTLTESGDIDIQDVTETRDITNARKLLTDNIFDLLLLDMRIPYTIGDTVRDDGGTVFLETIISDKSVNVPQNIILISAFKNILEGLNPNLKSIVWDALFYDATSSDWSHQLQQKVRFLHISKISNQFKSSFEYDVAVVTALDSELKGILSLPLSWQPLDVHNDATRYYKGQLSNENSRITLVCAAAPRMGMPAASVLSTKVIYNFRPKYIVMTGITAGVPGRSEIGDILIADPCWDWGSGKIGLKEDASVFFPSPHHLNLDVDIKAKLHDMGVDKALLENIKYSFRGGALADSELSVHIGPVASGASVLENPSIVESIKLQHRKLLGVEMETYGVFAAAEVCSRPRPIPISMKAVCDFADIHKNDKYHPYAIHCSSTFFFNFLKRYFLS